jgi:hypothetical protein
MTERYNSNENVVHLLFVQSFSNALLIHIHAQ